MSAARLVGYFIGMALGAALFGAVFAAATEWIVTRFTARNLRSVALSYIAASVPLAALLWAIAPEPSMGLAAAAIGWCIVWWLRLRSFAKQSEGPK